MMDPAVVKELEAQLRETESEVRNLADLLEMERAARLELRQSYATHVIAMGALDLSPYVDDPEVVQIVKLHAGRPVGTCSSCRKQRPLALHVVSICVFCRARPG